MDIRKILKELKRRVANDAGIRIIKNWLRQRTFKVGHVISDKDIFLLMAKYPQKMTAILNGLKTLEENGYFETKNDGRALTSKWEEIL